MGVRYTIHNQDEIVAYKLETIAKEKNISRNQLVNQVLTDYVYRDQKNELYKEILDEMKEIRESMSQSHAIVHESLIKFIERLMEKDEEDE